ncbi:hypothetical protein [Oricola nitratireducens]|uniref:hypothetical protein n=1 Tax=Oricola nitratireducens TaxID=2775868 RepID=UPI0018672AE7|nr:hypothetical protein [Oricola nitratireducens]
MTRHFMATVNNAASLDEAIEIVSDALGTFGFDVVWDIDAAALIKEKTGTEIAPRRILGVFHSAANKNGGGNEPAPDQLLPFTFVMRDNGPAVEVVLAGSSGPARNMKDVFRQIEVAARAPVHKAHNGHDAIGPVPVGESQLRPDQALKLFADRLDAMTERFRQTGSLVGAESATDPQSAELGELKHDILTLNSTVRHIMTLLDDAEHKSYATRHFD